MKKAIVVPKKQRKKSRQNKFVFESDYQEKSDHEKDKSKKNSPKKQQNQTVQALNEIKEQLNKIFENQNQTSPKKIKKR